ncbi:hypothetical protein T05_15076 [Trichinella murrelli]|uniref:Integrase catalytic domain-containing protein n=1 Tax=Trichinella murrelli TaxID=144512 RepID=A0A0V0TF03_9BILA|nr:hypothetical protein T05_13839 [Trichinella murrelli]KRX37579.1 hypothetical protein T05_15076 [Trichinella murrelli]
MQRCRGVINTRCCFPLTERLWRSSCNESTSGRTENQTVSALRRRYWVIRGRQAMKRYIISCITRSRQDVCAVHIDIVADMTTTSFLSAFRRFVARRGNPEVIQSDNFRTCKQADAFMCSLFVGMRAEQFQNELASRCIQWRYTTERAPWSGGYWESLVRSAENALRKVPGRSLRRFHELRTTLCELESRINNRIQPIIAS